MNVFVLCSGRCGSLTFAKACGHIKNYTAGHESLSNRWGGARLDYPDGRIEVDNRFVWMLGPLKYRYPNAYYLHLTRDREETAESFWRLWGTSKVINAWANHIMINASWHTRDKIDICRHLVDTANANIEVFLEGVGDDKRRTMDIKSAKEEFPLFCEEIGAVYDRVAAVETFNVRHNPSMIEVSLIP